MIPKIQTNVEDSGLTVPWVIYKDAIDAGADIDRRSACLRPILGIYLTSLHVLIYNALNAV